MKEECDAKVLPTLRTHRRREGSLRAAGGGRQPGAAHRVEPLPWTVSFQGNLVRVCGTSPTTGITRLGVGAQNTSWVDTAPGPPINEVTLTFSLVGVAPRPPQSPPLPPNPVLPVYFRDFVFAQEAGYEGRLQSVTASFVD